MSWMLPKTMRTTDPDELRRAALVQRYATTTFRLCIGFPPLLYFFGEPLLALGNIFGVALIRLSPLTMRITGSAWFACHVFVFSTVGLIVGLSMFLGGLNAPPLPFILAGPMSAAFLLGLRAGAFWSGVSVVIIMAISIAEGTGFQFPNYSSLSQTLFLRGAGLATIIMITMIFLAQFDAVTKQALAEVQAVNRRVAKMISHVEATSASLSHSAAEFLGTDDPDNSAKARAGLTQEMMSTASAGRIVLQDMAGSLRGMIGHYESISQRVADLHGQSGLIERMVQSIDNISGRLDLMALNTGIEAIHAGDSGKRFRLLSEDMRRLAERVSVETARIKGALQQVKMHTDAALDVSIKGHVLTDEGSAKLELMSNALDDMYRLIEHAAEASKRMSTDTKNQITAIRELASAGKAVT